MTTNDRVRLIFHGAVVLLAGLLCGLPTTAEAINESGRDWHTAHEALIMMGVWMLAGSSTLHVLVLGRREATALVWSLLLMGYGFAVGLVVGGINGTSAFAPGNTPVTWASFLAAVIGILGAILAAALTLIGARAALSARPRAT